MSEAVQPQPTEDAAIKLRRRVQTLIGNHLAGRRVDDDLSEVMQSLEEVDQSIEDVQSHVEKLKLARMRAENIIELIQAP